MKPFASNAGCFAAARPWIVAGWAVCAALAEQLPTVVFSPREGLHTTVHRIVADSKGFMWMPGEEGLARFDGNRFRIFTPADGLPAGVPLDIFERTDGTYWVAVREQFCLFDPRPGRPRFQCESPKLGLIHRILEDDRGIWCGTATGLWRSPGNGPRRWEPVGPIKPVAPNRSLAVYRMLKDSRGDLWTTSDSCLYRFRRDGRVDRWTNADGLAPDSGTALSETPDTIWVGSAVELLRLSIDTSTGDARIAGRYGPSHGLPSRYVVDVRYWDGAVWAATFKGLARQLPSGRWQAVELHPSLATLPLECLAADSLGHLWVGTTGGGAARVSASGFSSFSERDGLGVRKVWAVFEDRNGELTAVTKDEDDYSLSRFDGYRFHALRPNAPYPIEFGWSWSHIAVHSRTGEWWLGTGLGVLHYKNQLSGPPVRLGPELGLPLGTMRVFEDSRGAIWASLRAVSNNGLFRRDPGAVRFERLDESRGLPPLNQDENCPVSFAEDRSGQVWIGMLNGGLVRFRDGAFQQFPPSSGAPDQGVRALLVDREGRLWIGASREGLLAVDDPGAATPIFRAHTKVSGPSSTVLALAEDLTGRIYAAGGGGINRLDPATGRVRQFTGADGVPPGEFRVATRDRHGALWFGGDQGLVRLQPREDRTDPPAVLIYSVQVNGQDRFVSDLGDAEPPRLSLGASERQVQMDFGGFRHDLLYQTRLSGVDREWTPPSASRSVHYVSLAPGSYELEIRAVSPEGSLSAPPARARFRIAAPVWQRWWFLMAAAAAGAALILVWHRSRLDRYLAIERVRSRIATDLHDDIGASLSRIAMITEALRIQDGPANTDSPRLLGEIADTARSLVEEMSDIVWSIDPRRDTLRDLAARLRAFGFGVLEPRGIRWTFEAPEETLPRRLSPGQRRQLYLILKEALHNIARHSQAGSATLRIGLKGQTLWGEIEDDGRGYRPDGQEGLGIRSMRARAEQLGGELEVTARPEGGTRVSLRFPLGAKDA